MSEGRFRVGDTVVLNGHRLVFEPSEEAPKGYVWLSPNPAFGAGLVAIPEVLLPDPEPREEPEPDYPPGSVWQDADGQVYRRTSHTPEPMWQGFGAGLQYLPDDYPTRPLTRLVPGAAVPDDARDAWDTFGTKRGVVMAEPALTPGQPVAHKDGRFGTYTAVGTGLAASSALWRPFGELDSEYVNAADLRPVTLIERPDRDNALALMCPRIHSGRREQVLSSCIAEDIYTALFGPGEPL